jgi:hypothetical protein
MSSEITLCPEIIFEIKQYRELHELRKFVEQNNGECFIKITNYLLAKKFISIYAKGIPVEVIMHKKL